MFPFFPAEISQLITFLFFSLAFYICSLASLFIYAEHFSFSIKCFFTELNLLQFIIEKILLLFN